MKILNFSVVEILPALLDKSKTQTIRPAFKDNKEKPARFKVGEKVKLMWKQRSKRKLFCKKCGYNCFQVKNKITEKCDGTTFFKKKLGIVEITEVFKIEMWTGNDVPLITGYKLKGTYKLARRDGFKDLFNWFHKKYDLSEPKQFWVYRWKWLE